MKKLTLTLFALLFSLSTSVHAFAPTQAPLLNSQDYTISQSYEHILNYDTTVTVQKDSSLIVDETIKVYAGHISINHGIYRDFPTLYSNALGLKDSTTFEVQQVTVDGVDTAYHFTDMSNGTRLYIGDSNNLVPIGIHDYHIIFKTQNQMRFGAIDTELFYNLVGTGWDFMIDEIHGQIILPFAIKQSDLEINGYSGTQDQKGANFDYTVTTLSDTTVLSVTSKTQYRHNEGLTFSLIFAKNSAISAPSPITLTLLFLQANVGFVLITLLTLASVTFAIIIWFIKGRDPKRGVIIPLFSPPEGFNPAAVRYLAKMGFDNKILTATITSMATKGYIQLVEKDDVYSITKKSFKLEDLDDQEKEVIKLFGAFGKLQSQQIVKALEENPKVKQAVSEDIIEEITKTFTDQDSDVETFTFTQAHHTKISSWMENSKKLLSSQIGKQYFSTNGKMVLINLLFTIISLIVFIIFYAGSEEGGSAVFLMFWISFWTFGVIAMLPTFFNMFREFGKILKGQSSGMGKSFSIIFQGCFTLPFIFGEVFALYIFMQFAPLPIGLALMIQAATLYLLIKAIKARTKLGRDTMDKIEGFKMFLATTEEKHYELMQQKTPLTLDVYEKYLPFAIALDVEVPWTEGFKKQIDEALTESTSGNNTYMLWYTSSHPFNANTFSSGVSGLSSGLSSSISSSSMSPSSSSGGGGGGGSGGGGGGGGGGGW